MHAAGTHPDLMCTLCGVRKAEWLKESFLDEPSIQYCSEHVSETSHSVTPINV